MFCSASAEPFGTITLSCPQSGAGEIAAIRARGNLPLVIGGQVLAEIGRGDLNDNWTAAARMPAAEAARLTEKAGRRLAEILDDNLDAADLTDMVSDAAVLFLLALKRHGVPCASRVPPCTVVWESASGQGAWRMRASGLDDQRS